MTENIPTKVTPLKTDTSPIKKIGEMAVQSNATLYSLNLDTTEGKRLARGMAAKDLLTARANAKHIKANVRADQMQDLAEIDEISELYNYRKYIEDFRSEASHDIEILVNNNHLSDEEQLKCIRIDIGMLGMYNSKVSHSKGNEYIRNMASIIGAKEGDVNQFAQRHFSLFKAYRVGGDEFALLVRGKSENIEELFSLMREAVRQAPDITDITFSDGESDQYTIDRDNLIDFGITSSGSCIADYMKLNESAYGHPNPRGFVQRFVVFMNELADKKTDVLKGVRRVAMLKTLLDKSPKIFDEVYPYSAKGAQNITRIQLESIPEGGVDPFAKSHVIATIKRDQENEENRVQDPFQKVLHRYIREKIEQLCYG